MCLVPDGMIQSEKFPLAPLPEGFVLKEAETDCTFSNIYTHNPP